MVFIETLYISLLWHIILSVIALIIGIFVVDDDSKIIVILGAIIYCLFFPYGQREEIRNAQTESGNIVAVVVELKEPIVKLFWRKPVHVKVTSINGIKQEIKLSESSRFEVGNGVVFTGTFQDGDKRDTLLLIL